MPLEYPPLKLKTVSSPETIPDTLFIGGDPSHGMTEGGDDVCLFMVDDCFYSGNIHGVPLKDWLKTYIPALPKVAVVYPGRPPIVVPQRRWAKKGIEVLSRPDFYRERIVHLFKAFWLPRFASAMRQYVQVKAGTNWHGNEPSHHIAYLYALWGRRDKTAEIVGKICREAYCPEPGGLCGNDDCGQMSAWYLFSMMGFYPVNPCGDGYVLGEAQAEEIKLRVVSEGAGEFRIVGGEGGVVLNGKAIDGVKISHEDIMRGGTLEFWSRGCR